MAPIVLIKKDKLVVNSVAPALISVNLSIVLVLINRGMTNIKLYNIAKIMP